MKNWILGFKQKSELFEFDKENMDEKYRIRIPCEDYKDYDHDGEEGIIISTQDIPLEVKFLKIRRTRE